MHSSIYAKSKENNTSATCWRGGIQIDLILILDEAFMWLPRKYMKYNDPL